MAEDILTLLETKGYKPIHKGGFEYAIPCPNQAQHSEGTDNNPSLFINIDKKKAHCFVCGFKLSEVGLIKWLMGEGLDEEHLRILRLKSSIQKVNCEEQLTLVSNHDCMFPPGTAWDQEGYRGISLDTYRKVGAIKCTRGRYANRLIVEVKMYGELVGLDARALGNEVPKYLRPKGCNAKGWLFPYDLCREIIKTNKLNYVVIAEGMFHSLNACQYNIPAVCYFGANNFSADNVLQILDLQISEVIIFPDKDTAGLQVINTIAPMLTTFFDVSIANISSLCLDTEASASKGKLVYQDLGDLEKEGIMWAIENRSRYKGD